MRRTLADTPAAAPPLPLSGDAAARFLLASFRWLQQSSPILAANTQCIHQTNQQTHSKGAESATDERLAPARDPGHERRWLDLMKASQYTQHIAGVCHRPSSSAISHVLAAS